MKKILFSVFTLSSIFLSSCDKKIDDNDLKISFENRLKPLLKQNVNLDSIVVIESFQINNKRRIAHEKNLFRSNNIMLLSGSPSEEVVKYSDSLKAIIDSLEAKDGQALNGYLLKLKTYLSKKDSEHLKKDLYFVQFDDKAKVETIHLEDPYLLYKD
ncbi:hypothetical protein [Aureivirga sp. CE67]|uniref:hypothetical protein n=1 Tax=Aureivirga sp. CE67 TaxID=1788983 RepID=UPI0018CBD7C0|nr:hypothetical protein [Aureivirga sp. CE67]